jgi:hypothetical protein
MDKKRTVAVLFLGSIERTDDPSRLDKPTDEIDFGRPVKITLIRIPKPKRELYGRLTSITQVPLLLPRASPSKTSRFSSGTWMKRTGDTRC